MTTVLAIDDNEVLQSTRKLVLEKEGFRVLTAETAREGLRVFQQEHVDVAVVDYHLPDMNGDEVCRLLRQRNARLPIIFASGYEPLELTDCADYLVLKGGSPLDLLRKDSRTDEGSLTSAVNRPPTPEGLDTLQ
jgi:CheY-like chemotaxis protein